MSNRMVPGLLAHSLETLDRGEFYTLETPRYGANYLTNEAANELPWEEFRDFSGAVHNTKIGQSDLEAIVVPKSVTWSDRDVNIYVGSPQREVSSFLDFARDDFSIVFGW